MDTRFNSFYREETHPFVEAMQVRLPVHTTTIVLTIPVLLERVRR